MADLKHLKVKPQYGFDDNDPLAELTRIMGIDSGAAAQEQDDDFGIDLERELLGEFGKAGAAGEKDPSTTSAAQPSYPNLSRSGSEESQATGSLAPHRVAEPSSPIERAASGAEPQRPALRVVEPYREEPAADHDADAALEQELSDLLGDDQQITGDQSQHSADGEYDDPLGQLEAFSKDWFARRQAVQDAPASESEDSAASGDRFERAKIGEAAPDVFAGSTAAAVDGAIADDASAVRNEALYDDSEEASGTMPEAVWPEDETGGAVTQTAQRDAPPPAPEPTDDDRVFDPFAELEAMNAHQAPPEEAAAYDAGYEATHLPGDPMEAIQADTGSAFEQSTEEYDRDLDEAYPGSNHGAAEFGDGANGYDAESWAEPQAPFAGYTEEAPPQSADFGRWTPETPVEEPADESLGAQEVAFDDEFDLGQMLESELAAEAAQITGMRAPGANRADTASPSAPLSSRPTRRLEQPEPDVDTVEVPVSQWDVADDLDIPDLVFEDEVSSAGETDELDLDFANAFEELGRPGDREAGAAYGAAPYQLAPASYSAVDRSAGRRSPVSDAGASPEAFHQQEDLERSWEHDHFPEENGYPAGDWIEDTRGDAQGDIVASAFHEDASVRDVETAPSRRRGMIVAAAVAGIAVAGALGAFVLSVGGNGGGSEPALVAVDPSPVKVRPEQPGGTVIPNEDKAVYDRVASGGEDEPPAQETLLSEREEPIDVAARVPASATETDDAAAGLVRTKSEDRLEQDIEQAIASPADDIAAIAPRKVRTMVVRPDGTLVPREDPVVAAVEPAPAAEQEQPRLAEPTAEVATVASEAAAPSSEETVVATGSANEAGASESRSQAVAVAEPAAAVEAQPAEAAPPANAPAAIPAQAEADTAPVRVVESRSFTADGQSTPARGPVAPTRPSDQPVEIVGSAGDNAQRSTQVAAAQPAALPAAPASEWSMQIASQPSPEGAQKSYVSLAQRYGSILGGRGVNIVKADIAGKGTFWRVRIPAQSRGEAVELCERYKAAGGSCFVAK